MKAKVTRSSKVRPSATRRLGFTEVGSKSISRRIVDQILDKVLAGALRPGDFIGTEQELAQTFGASRLPVREAIGRLDAMGVVAVTTGVTGGARVAGADLDRVASLLAIHFALAGIGHQDLLDARAAVEPLVVKLAAERATGDDLANLRDRLRAVVRAVQELEDGSSYQAFQHAGKAMSAVHNALASACHNMVLTGLMRVIERNLFYRYVELRDPNVGAVGLEYFRNIVALVLKRDGEAAGQLAREHLAKHGGVFKARNSKQGGMSSG